MNPKYQLNDEKVRGIYQSICNWNRWGSDDQLGTLNYINSDHVIKAKNLIIEGHVIGCGRVIDTVPSPMNNVPAQHYMVAAGDLASSSGASVAYDFVGVFPHGQAQSHIDALCHIADAGLLYNKFSAASVTSSGAKNLDVKLMSDGIVSRAVFLDIAGARNALFVDPERPITIEDLELAEKISRVVVGEGDILIYRTGRHERRKILGGHCERLSDGRGHLPGLYPDSLLWLHDRRVAMVASDCAHDALPTPFVQERIPIHVGTEVYMGLPLLHNLDLDKLACECNRRGVAEFFFSIAPLLISGGTASPVNPIAIF
ncbi:cyclase family protein [Porticoccaceae bacterium]|nr:cyclase family protein [Porticoccaceae bacterium]